MIGKFTCDIDNIIYLYSLYYKYKMSQPPDLVGVELEARRELSGRQAGVTHGHHGLAEVGELVDGVEVGVLVVLVHTPLLPRHQRRAAALQHQLRRPHHAGQVALGLVVSTLVDTDLGIDNMLDNVGVVPVTMLTRLTCILVMGLKGTMSTVLCICLNTSVFPSTASTQRSSAVSVGSPLVSRSITATSSPESCTQRYC